MPATDDRTLTLLDALVKQAKCECEEVPYGTFARRCARCLAQAHLDLVASATKGEANADLNALRAGPRVYALQLPDAAIPALGTKEDCEAIAGKRKDIAGPPVEVCVVEASMMDRLCRELELWRSGRLMATLLKLDNLRPYRFVREGG